MLIWLAGNSTYFWGFEVVKTTAVAVNLYEMKGGVVGARAHA